MNKARLSLLMFLFMVLGMVMAQDDMPQFEVTESTPIIVPDIDSSDWDNGFSFTPDVIEYEGVYYLFYTGFGWSGSTLLSGIGFATSEDGINWEKSSANPVMDKVTPARFAGHPQVLVEADGTWLMIATQVSNAGISPFLFRLTAPSPEGPWTTDPRQPILEGEAGTWRNKFFPLDIIKTEDEYRLYFAGFTNDEEIGQLGLATSVDGITWDIVDEPILSIGEEGEWDSALVLATTVLPTEDSWQLFYIGAERNVGGPQPRDAELLWMGYATSEDGINWTKHEANPVFQFNQRRGVITSAFQLEDTIQIIHGSWLTNGMSQFGVTINTQ